MKSWLVGLSHFLAPKGAEKLSEQGKEVDDLKKPQTLANTRLFPFELKVFLDVDLKPFSLQFLSRPR
ncbi:hypothetical protein NDI37_24635 [Funiculus sociatus GB2-A5]|uniref:Uncharacterized protein n=1 Tax=Funiculus sociatus GB2-A5 TaxID=2933946 RepID=A0ABV0JW09_9CYAN|nr:MULTISPECIES: hypothetical protein [Cyanophyceae]MBD1923705.1 hypothetical protein [Microcoleus sp. FACHB-831]